MPSWPSQQHVIDRHVSTLGQCCQFSWFSSGFSGF